MRLQQQYAAMADAFRSQGLDLAAIADVAQWFDPGERHTAAAAAAAAAAAEGWWLNPAAAIIIIINSTRCSGRFLVHIETTLPRRHTAHHQDSLV